MKCKYVFYAMVITMVFSSCYSSRYLYNPPAHNVPVLIEKGDSKIAAYYSSNLSSNSSFENNGNLKKNNSVAFDLQAAYALSNHIALQALYTKRTEQNFADYNLNSFDTSIQHFNNQLIEFGIGYFTYMRSNKKVIFQIFAGAGKGSSSFTDEYQTPGNPAHKRFMNVDVTKFYLQPSFIVRYRNNFTTSISNRVSFINFSNTQTDYSPDEIKAYRLASLDQETSIFWEPAFSNVIGIKKIPGLQFEIQMGISFILSQRPIDYRSFNASAGVVLDLPKLFKGNTPDQKN